MGLHAMYDMMRRMPKLPPAPPKVWFVVFTFEGHEDKYEYATRTEAEFEANRLCETPDIVSDVTVMHLDDLRARNAARRAQKGTGP